MAANRDVEFLLDSKMSMLGHRRGVKVHQSSYVVQLDLGIDLFHSPKE